MRRRVVLEEAGCAAALSALNAWICWRLFWVEYTSKFNSVEGAFIGMARHISLHWGDFGWWTIWHAGMPYQDTYVPLLHLTVAAVTTLMRWPPAHAYHFVTGLTYSLGPATLYLMARRFDATRPAAIFAALSFSLFSPSAFLIPELGVDLSDPLAGRRLQVMTVYGEGPHVAAIALIPIALLSLEYALRRKTSRPLALAALGLGLVFLTNIPGSMALALAVFCWIAAQPAGRQAAALRTACLAAALGYGMVCFGVPPSSLGTVFGNVGSMHSGFSNSLRHAPYALALALAAIAAAGRAPGMARIPLFARFGVLYGALTALLVLTARHHLEFELLPQAGRLHLEMELALSLPIGWLVFQLYRWRPARYAVVAFGLFALWLQIGHYRWRARLDLTPASPAARSEYTTARWIDANLGGRRVYATGSTGFWLNAFTDTPQLTGCCDQGNSMRALSTVPFLLHKGVTPDATRSAIRWLQALGIHALVVNGPDSSDEYRDFLLPERFDGLLPVLHREHGDTIYAIPQRSGSMTHILKPGEEARDDSSAEATRYAAAIEDPNRAEAICDWQSSGHARIRATLQRGDAISVQTAWFRGWKATAGGAALPVSRDGIGLILIRPQCDGDCVIDLRWTGPWDLHLAAAISLLSIGMALRLLSI